MRLATRTRRRVRSHVTYANVVSTICLFALLGTGVATAATRLFTGTNIRDETLTTSDVKNGSLRGSDLKLATLGTKQIADGSIRAADLASASITPTKLPDASIAEAKLTGAVTTKLNNRGVSPWETIPSGTTVSGGFEQRYPIGSTPGSHAMSMQLPALPSLPLAVADVNFATDANAETTDDDATCTGTVGAPTAPAGKVCIYLDYVSNTSFMTASGWSNAGMRAVGMWSIAWSDNASGTAHFFGSWAYTAP